MRRLTCLGVVVVVLLGLADGIRAQDMTTSEKKKIRANLDAYFDTNWKDESLLNKAAGVVRNLDSRRQSSKKRSLLVDVAGVQEMVLAGQNFAANRMRGLKRIEWKESPLPGEAPVFHISVAKKYRPNIPAPVILALHAKGMNAKGYVSEAFLKNKGFQDRYIIVAPAWPGAKLKTWGTEKDEGLGTLLGALLYVRTHFLIDHDRVYLVGQGEGGKAALDLAMKYGDRFAGVFALGATVDEDHPLAENLEMLEVSEMDAAGSAVNVSAHDRVLTTIEADEGLRRNVVPKSVNWRFSKGRVGGLAWWLFVENGRELDDDECGQIEAEIKADNVIEVTTKGVDTFRICLNDLMVDLDQPVQVVINGVKQEPWKATRSLKTAVNWMADIGDLHRVFVAMRTFSVPVAEDEKDGADEDDDTDKDEGEEHDKGDADK